MLEPLVTEKQRALRDEVRRYVKSVPKQLLQDMDADKIRYPREYVVGLAKKFGTETAWEVINNAMQVVGGIGYTNVFPIEKMLRDARLLIIWTGTSEIMDLIIQHEYYRETLKPADAVRNIEDDAQEAHAVDGKIYE